MASSSEPKIVTLKAAAAITRGKAVKVGADDDHIAVASAATDKSIGLIQNTTTAAEDFAEIALPGGGAKGLLGGTVANGDMLAPDSNGALVATTTENDRVIAMAMQAGVANDYIDVEVIAAVH